MLALCCMLISWQSGPADLPIMRVSQEVPYQSVNESVQLYHEDRAQTIRGVIKDKDTVRMKDDAAFAQLTLKTDDNRIIPVHLGPAWFVEENQHLMDLNVGREVQVKGSMETVAGRQVFVAAELYNDRREEGMRFRREDGTPAWVGGEYLP